MEHDIQNTNSELRVPTFRTPPLAVYKADGDMAWRTLTRTEKQLLKRAMKKASNHNGVWAESNSDVAKALKVDRSTVVRAIANLRAAGVLMPIDTKGGRGRVSSYLVNIERTKKLLKAGCWQKLPSRTPQEGHRIERLGTEALVDLVAREQVHLASLAPTGEEIGHLDPVAVLESELGDLVQDLKAEIADWFKDPLLKRFLLFAGVCVLDVFGIYFAWKKLGVAGALAASLPASLLAYKYWRRL